MNTKLLLALFAGIFAVALLLLITFFNPILSVGNDKADQAQRAECFDAIKSGMVSVHMTEGRYPGSIKALGENLGGEEGDYIKDCENVIKDTELAAGSNGKSYRLYDKGSGQTFYSVREIEE